MSLPVEDWSKCRVLVQRSLIPVNHGETLTIFGRHWCFEKSIFNSSSRFLRKSFEMGPAQGHRLPLTVTAGLTRAGRATQLSRETPQIEAEKSSAAPPQGNIGRDLTCAEVAFSKSTLVCKSGALRKQPCTRSIQVAWKCLSA